MSEYVTAKWLCDGPVEAAPVGFMPSPQQERLLSLAAAGYMWPLSALSASPGARARYDGRRAAGDWNATALRNLSGKLLGSLHHCLQTRSLYDEAKAFPNNINQPEASETLTP